MTGKGSMPKAASNLPINMHYSNDKEIATTVRHLLANGWGYISGKKHGKLTSPNGKKIPVPGTPSDWRASLNFKRDIRRISFCAQI